jgi:hypothetical protein
MFFMILKTHSFKITIREILVFELKSKICTLELSKKETKNRKQNYNYY